VALAAAIEAAQATAAAMPQAAVAAGALQQAPQRHLRSRTPAALRIGSLIPNPLVTTGHGPPVRLDTILRGRPAVLTSQQPSADLVDHCRQHRLLLVRVSGPPGERGNAQRSGAPAGNGWADVRLVSDREPLVLRALTGNPALTVLVRPDRVVAAVDSRARLPRLPWSIPGRLRSRVQPDDRLSAERDQSRALTP
jgi:hypothetical protein